MEPQGTSFSMPIFASTLINEAIKVNFDLRQPFQLKLLIGKIERKFN